MMEAKNSRVNNVSYLDSTEPQYELDDGIYMRASLGLKNELCVLQLAGEGLTALPDGCSWQMNFEEKLYLFNETNETLVLVLDEQLSKDRVVEIDELSIDENGNTVYKIPPGDFAYSLEPSIILEAYTE